MPAIPVNREEELNYNELTANNERRYPQWIQGQIDGGEVFDFDYDLVTGDAILANNAPFIDGRRRVMRVSGDMRLKDFLREYYGLRRFKMRIAFIDVPRALDEPRLIDQTFRALHTKHKLMQVDLITRQ